MSDRGRILMGSAAGAIFVAVWLLVGLSLWPTQSPVVESTAERLAYAIKADVFVLLTLLAGVLVVAEQRFFLNVRIDGSAPDEGTAMDINRRYLANTLEQSFLAVVGHLALAVVVPAESLIVIPVLAWLFVVGRLSFWVGYHISPPGRAFGLVATFAPTIGVYIYLLWQIL